MACLSDASVEPYTLYSRGSSVAVSIFAWVEGLDQRNYQCCI